MLGNADRELLQVVRFFAARGLEAGYLVPTATGLEKSIMDAHAQLSSYLCRTELHDFSKQHKGTEARVFLKTWLVKLDELVETKASLYRPETKSGDPRIWIYELSKHASAGNLLAILAHEGEIYVVNTSSEQLMESAAHPSSQLSHLLDMLVAARDKPLDDKFSEWNLRLLRSFFSEASKGEEVFLRVGKDFFDQVGQDIGGDAGFLEAVRAGPPWISSGRGLVQRFCDLASQRTSPVPNYKDPGDFEPTYRGARAPAYLPYLAALVRTDSENPGTSYYDHLKADLKLQHDFGPPEMSQVETVWADLEKWTASTQGRFGVFKLRRLGGYRRIGVPRSQSILKPDDIEDLARAFRQAEVRPGQDLSNDYIARILNAVRQLPWTAGFSQALGKPDFEQPIRAAIATAYSDWDGTVPAKDGAERGVGQPANANVPHGAGIGLTLVVLQDDPLTIAPRWRLPALHDRGQFEVAFEGATWRGQFAGTEGASTLPSAEQDERFWEIAKRASNEALDFNILLAGDGADTEPFTLQLPLRAHPLWILAPASDHSTGNMELREGDLPGSGPAYLLAPPSSLVSITGYLEREEPRYLKHSASGLPPDWLLISLLDCRELTPEQRLLPDGAATYHPMPRSIRFVGGRSIRRGYSRMYLPYDLPTVELDAPSGSRITCSEGLIIEEEWIPSHGSEGAQAHLTPRRRFALRLSHSRSASYELRVTTENGGPLGTAKLRIASLDGELVDVGRPFSIDRLGRPMTSTEGLSGAQLPYATEAFAPRANDLVGINLHEAALGSRATLKPFKPGVREQFLDRLGQSGSISYGEARDLLQRLIQSAGEPQVPHFVLLELRRRGHLEISTTHKGHIARVHAATPTFYSLPSTCLGKPIWAIAGTLRICHWEAIAREEKAWRAYRSKVSEAAFESWRLLIVDEEEAIERCLSLSFEQVEKPCLPIAQWSAGLDLVTAETFHDTMESIGSAREGARRFNAASGLFTAPPDSSFCELWKVIDLENRMENLYVLADRGRYAFVRDSRWGVWLAMDAFAKWVSQYPGMSGVHPLPMTYENESGTIWLPARIGLPCILERALVFCSGDTPEILKLRVEDKGQRILLSRTPGSTPILSASRFYDDMACGQWLAYRYVPEAIARLFAEKLGAVLDII